MSSLSPLTDFTHCHRRLGLFGLNKLDINEFSAIQVLINLIAYLNSFIYIDLLVFNNSSFNVHEHIFFIHIEWVMTSKKFPKLSFLSFLCIISAFHDVVPTMFLSPSLLNIARSQCIVLGCVLKASILL